MCLVLPGAELALSPQLSAAPQKVHFYLTAKPVAGQGCLGWPLAFQGVMEEPRVLLCPGVLWLPGHFWKCLPTKLPRIFSKERGKVSSFSHVLVRESLDILCQDTIHPWGQISANKDLPGRGMMVTFAPSAQPPPLPRCISHCISAQPGVLQTPLPIQRKTSPGQGNIPSPPSRGCSWKCTRREKGSGCTRHFLGGCRAPSSEDEPGDQPGDQLCPGITESQNCWSGKRPGRSPSPAMNPAQH